MKKIFFNYNRGEFSVLERYITKTSRPYKNFAKLWQHKREKDDVTWADEPLTAIEEKELEQGRRNFKNGDYLTLAQFKEQMANI